MAGEKQIKIERKFIVLLAFFLIIVFLAFWLFLNKDYLFKRLKKEEPREPIGEIYISFEVFKTQFLKEAKSFEKISAPEEKGRENPMVFY